MTEKIKAQVLGQDAFVSALVKAFRRPFVLGTADDTAHARSVMLLCGPNGTGRHYALQCVVDELAARGVLHSAAVETLDLALYPGPAQEKLFLQDLYAALQSDAEVLTFEHYESCAANYLNMLATLAMDGTLALSSRYVLQRGILVDVGTALAPVPSASCRPAASILCSTPTRARPRWPTTLGQSLWTPLRATSAAPRRSPRGAGRRGRAGAELSGPAHPQAVRTGADHGRRCA